MNVRVRATVWARMGHTKVKSGEGVPVDVTVTEFAESLKEESLQVVEKGRGMSYALGTSSKGGSGDDEAQTIDGLLLDSDHPQDAEKIDLLLTQLEACGIAYIHTRRARKSHVLLFFERPFQPPHGGKAEDLHKAARRALIAEFGKQCGAELDPSPGKRYLGLIYVRNRLPNAPEGSEGDVLVTWREGAGLDFPAALEALGVPTPAGSDPTDFFAAAKAHASAPPPEMAEPLDPMTPLETETRIRKRAATCSDPNMKWRIAYLLSGRSWASTSEHRNEISQRLTTWLAAYTEGRGDVEKIVEMAAKSLDAMTAEQDTGFGADAEKVFQGQLVRNMSQMGEKLRGQAAALERIKNTFTKAPPEDKPFVNRPDLAYRSPETNLQYINCPPSDDDLPF